MVNYSYTDVFSKLNFYLAIVTFVKKDGTIRKMLCTRNTDIADIEYRGVDFVGKLTGKDRHNSKDNGNIAVVDMVIGELRSFSVKRVLDIDWLGELKTKEEIDNAYVKFSEVKDYEEISIDSI